jgi:type III pantothenate kinase
MTTPGHPPVRPAVTVLVADVGNTRIKLAVVEDHEDHGDVAGERRLPRVGRRQDLLSRDFRPANLENWLAGVAPGPALLLVASVHEAAAVRLEAAVAEVSATRHRAVRQRRIGHADLPLEVAIDEPHRVGIDRLAAAAAAVLVKEPGRPAIVVDCGTATTVNVVSAAGAFLGGAILPGPALMARALAEGTSRLPDVTALADAPPPPMPARSTRAAIAAGIGWGVRGAVERLVAEAQRPHAGAAQVILTGGAAGMVRDCLPGAVELPDLVLAGIALAATSAGGR